MVSGVTVPKETTVAATIVEDEGTTTVLALADAERLGVRPDLSLLGSPWRRTRHSMPSA